MSKVIKFPVPMTQADWAKECMGFIESEDKVIIVIQKPSGHIMTGYWDLTFAEIQVLLGHIQADIIKGMIEDTYDVTRKEYEDE